MRGVPSADHVADAWARLTSVSPEASTGLVLVSGAVAVLMVSVPALWRRTRHLVTIAHEGAHGVAALVSGRQLAGIRLHSDTSGLTVSRGRSSGPGMVATAAAGYVGPALLGLVSAWLLSRGHAVAVLWIVLASMALLLLQIRNFFGLWSVLAAGSVVFLVSRAGSPGLQLMFAYVLTWFLLVAAPRPVVELQQARRMGHARDSDADTLARLTRVPGALWVGGFLLVTLGCLWQGASLLLGR
jgi:hypothetical protein